ncbi:MAG TPA: inner membrane CreD family protein [Puia sp.]|nr:inner membrane CreD family protein [Puia sp.]
MRSEPCGPGGRVPADYPQRLNAAIATIGLISWYVGSVLRSPRTSLFIALILAVQYGFVFILIQSQDYALLMGSIGLFIILAIVMYFSRKIQWEKIPTA